MGKTLSEVVRKKQNSNLGRVAAQLLPDADSGYGGGGGGGGASPITITHTDNSGSTTGNNVPDGSMVIAPPIPDPSPCPGGCPAGYKCTEDKGCVSRETGQKYRRDIKVDTDNGNGSTGTTNGGGGNGTKTVVAEGQNVIKKAVDELKKVDPKIWYAVGGGTLFLLILNANS